MSIKAIAKPARNDEVGSLPVTLKRQIRRYLHAVGRAHRAARSSHENGLVAFSRINKCVSLGERVHRTRDVESLEEPARSRVMSLRRQHERAVREIIIEGAGSGVFQVSDPFLASFGILEMCVSVARWFDPAGWRRLCCPKTHPGIPYRTFGAGDSSTFPSRPAG